MKDGRDQIVSEYRRFQSAGRSPPESKLGLPDGSVMELCHTNGSDWTLCVLRPGDGALTPVAVGDDIAAVMRRYKEVLEGWQPALWPPLSVVIEGATRVFVPAGMSLLLGVVELAGGALLLGVLKRAGKSCVALLHVRGHRVSVLHIGGPTDLRSVDVDGLLELKEAVVQLQTEALTVALLAAFARLLVRALKPRKRAGPRRRGVGAVLLFLWILVQLIRMGSGDLYGRRRDIAAQIKALLPGVDLPRRALGDVLTLMLETRTCLVSRDGSMLWLIRLSTLNSLESALHQKFCAEAPGTVADVEEFIRICASDTPPERSKHQPTMSRTAQKPTTEAEHSRQPKGSSTENVVDTDPPVLLSFIRMLLERTANAQGLKNTGVIEPSGSGPARPPSEE